MYYDLDSLEELYNGGYELCNYNDDLSDFKEELLNDIAKIILVYLVVNEFIKMSKADQVSEYRNIRFVITTYFLNDKKVKKDEFKSFLTNIKWTSKSEVLEVLNAKINDKAWWNRLIKNKNDTVKNLLKTVRDFLSGKISVNDIKGKIEKIIKFDIYKDKRLIENEIARVTNELNRRKFIRNGVKKVRRNEILDARTCEECIADDGHVYNIDEAPILPAHVKCRGFYVPEE